MCSSQTSTFYFHWQRILLRLAGNGICTANYVTLTAVTLWLQVIEDDNIDDSLVSETSSNKAEHASQALPAHTKAAATADTHTDMAAEELLARPQKSSSVLDRIAGLSSVLSTVPVHEAAVGGGGPNSDAGHSGVQGIPAAAPKPNSPKQAGKPSSMSLLDAMMNADADSWHDITPGSIAPAVVSEPEPVTNAENVPDSSWSVIQHGQSKQADAVIGSSAERQQGPPVGQGGGNPRKADEPVVSVAEGPAVTARSSLRERMKALGVLKK